MSPLSTKKRLLRHCGRLIREFDLIKDGDNIMVAVSGGKDSLALLYLLAELRRKAPVKFHLVAVHLYQGQPGFELDGVRENVAKLGFELVVINKPTYNIVQQKRREGQVACFMCSRLRRGILYNHAHENGFNKIALGHHREDMLETFLLNLFRTGQIKTIPPLLVSDDKRNTIIRPLLYCPESELITLVEGLGIKPVPCGFCSSQPEQERKRMRRLIEELEKENPTLREVMVAAMKNVRAGYLLDKGLLTTRVGAFESEPESSEILSADNF
ncbi:MAG: tRNA 2-thiocytidine(32) synthetase TtcA [Myxococcota bacterium]